MDRGGLRLHVWVCVTRIWYAHMRTCAIHMECEIREASDNCAHVVGDDDSFISFGFPLYEVIHFVCDDAVCLYMQHVHMCGC